MRVICTDAQFHTCLGAVVVCGLVAIIIVMAAIGLGMIQ